MKTLMVSSIVILVATITGSSITLGEDYTTQDLLEDCRGRSELFCLGYLGGAAGILFEMHDNGDTVPTKQENVRLVVSACAMGVSCYEASLHQLG